jgi:hypothetical protein
VRSILSRTVAIFLGFIVPSQAVELDNPGTIFPSSAKSNKAGPVSTCRIHWSKSSLRFGDVPVGTTIISNLTFTASLKSRQSHVHYHGTAILNPRLGEIVLDSPLKYRNRLTIEPHKINYKVFEDKNDVLVRFTFLLGNCAVSFNSRFHQKLPSVKQNIRPSEVPQMPRFVPPLSELNQPP